jgi:hypothetical protein
MMAISARNPRAFTASSSGIAKVDSAPACQAGGRRSLEQGSAVRVRIVLWARAILRDIPFYG